uniref:Prokaryotic-type class I peptide chain release factors domain-containing protein n=1 Tax=Strigamia maritima TaxID=126957 RepID=T1JD56_STRMM
MSAVVKIPRLKSLFPSMPVLINTIRSKQTIDYSKVPKINDDELEEQFVRGSGPGGQAVNKTSSCILLKHLPTGIVIKCQFTRSQSQNRKIARQLLQEKLDDFYNGEMSVQAQEKREAQMKLTEKLRRTKKRLEIKMAFKEREGLD